MKTGFKKSLALLLAVFMAFGAAPFALGIAVFAEDVDTEEPVYALKSISVSPESKTLVVGEELKLQVVGAFVNTADATDVTAKAINNTDVDWSSSDSKLATVSSEGVVTALAVCDEVIIKAADKTDGNIKSVCKIKIEKAPVYVDSITWNWKATALLVGQTVNLTSSMYTMIPDKPDNTEVELSCSPASAVQFAQDGKSFKVNPLPAGTTQLTITLTLTAKGAGKDCKPATKQLKILDDIPLTEVKWDYKVGETNKTLFEYGKTQNNITEKYFYPYKYTAKAGESALDSSALSLCEVKITSSDNRVVRPDDKCQCFIPVGNGQANITVTVKTPKGVTRSNTITVVVEKSPYTPITMVGIGYDEKNTDSNASYDSATNTISLMYTHGIQLTANLNKDAKLDQKAIVVTMDDGRKEKIVSDIEYKWSSSNESVATVDKNGKVSCVGVGSAVITLHINDNGTEFTKTINIKGAMSWWEALVGIFMSIISFNFTKVPVYFKALFSAIF